MKEKESVILYQTQCRSMLKLPPEQRGELFGHVVRFAFDRETPEAFSDMACEVLFDQISAQIERDQAKYTDRCKENQRIALEREQRKREQRERERMIHEQESTNVHEREPTYTNSTDTDTGAYTDTDTYTYSGSVKDKAGELMVGTVAHTPTRAEVDSFYLELCHEYSVKPRDGYVERFLTYHFKEWKAEMRKQVQEDIARGVYDGKQTTRIASTGAFNNFEPSSVTNYGEAAERIILQDLEFE